MSVVCHEFIANHHTQITEAETVAVGANGAPLDVIGLTTLTVSLESFTTQQKFTVVRQLTVDCLLGADFLQNNNAMIDYHTKTLTVGKQKRHSIPLTLGRQPHQQEESMSKDVIVRCPKDLSIPGRTIQLITGKVDSHHSDTKCFLLEPLKESSANFV